MKKTLFIIALLFSVSFLNAQTVINTTNYDVSFIEKMEGFEDAIITVRFHPYALHRKAATKSILNVNGKIINIIIAKRLNKRNQKTTIIHNLVIAKEMINNNLLLNGNMVTFKGKEYDIRFKQHTQLHQAFAREQTRLIYNQLNKSL